MGPLLLALASLVVGMIVGGALVAQFARALMRMGKD